MGWISLPLNECKVLAEALGQGNLKVHFVSDGLVKARQAGHVWEVACNAADTQVDGAGPCDINPDTADSFRAKYASLLAMGYFF